MVKPAIGRYAEALYPWVVGLVFTVGSYLVGMHFDPGKMSNQLSSIINIAAIFMGFLATAKAMLLSLSSKRLAWVRSHSQVWHQVLSFFKQALMANFVLCIYSLLLFSLDLDKLRHLFPSAEWATTAFNYLTNFQMPIWLGLVALSVCSFYRVLNVVFAILKTDN
jgi:hypothetical protein